MIQVRDKDLYNYHLSSLSWTKKKRKAYLLFGKFCQRCGSEEYLTVHHKTYERLGHEDVEKDLAILCKTCHNLYHMIHPRATIETTNFFIAKGAHHVYIPGQFKKRKKVKVMDHYPELIPWDGVYYLKGKRRKASRRRKVYY